VRNDTGAINRHEPMNPDFVDCKIVALRRRTLLCIGSNVQNAGLANRIPAQQATLSIVRPNARPKLA
jgi:hypothetical protein